MRAPSELDLVHAVSLATLEPGAAPLVVTVHDLLWRRIPDAYPPRGRRWHEGGAGPGAAPGRPFHRAGRGGGRRPGGGGRVPGGDHGDPDGLGPPAATRLVPRPLAHLESAGGARAVPPVRRDPGAAQEPPAPDRGLRDDPGLAARAVAAGHGRPVGLGRPGAPTGRRRPSPARCRRRSWPASTRPPGSWPTCRSSRGSACHRSRRCRSGTPVVASPLPSTGGAAYEVDPNDTASIAAGLLDRGHRRGHPRRRWSGAARPGSTELSWASIARAPPRGVGAGGGDRTVRRTAGSMTGTPVAGTGLRVALDVSAVPDQPVGAGPLHPAAGPGLLGPRRTSTSCCAAGRPTATAGRRWWPRGTCLPPPRTHGRSGWPGSRCGSARWSTASGATVHHGPHYTMPRRCPVPSVVTVHDLSFFDEPRMARALEGAAASGGPSRRAAREAAVVVCPSRVTAEALRPLVPGRRRGGGRPPWGRHRPVPSRGALAGSRRRPPGGPRRPG